MFGLDFLNATASLERSPAALSLAGVTARPRRIALLQRGRRLGLLTRLIAPWDVGELSQLFRFRLPALASGEGGGLRVEQRLHVQGR